MSWSNIPCELFYLIAFYLEFKTICVCGRVCWDWKNIVNVIKTVDISKFSPFVNMKGAMDNHLRLSHKNHDMNQEFIETTTAKFDSEIISLGYFPKTKMLWVETYQYFYVYTTKDMDVIFAGYRLRTDNDDIIFALTKKNDNNTLRQIPKSRKWFVYIDPNTGSQITLLKSEDVITGYYCSSTKHAFLLSEKFGHLIFLSSSSGKGKSTKTIDLGKRTKSAWDSIFRSLIFSEIGDTVLILDKTTSMLYTCYTNGTWFETSIKLYGSFTLTYNDFDSPLGRFCHFYHSDSKLYLHNLLTDENEFVAPLSSVNKNSTIYTQNGLNEIRHIKKFDDGDILVRYDSRTLSVECFGQKANLIIPIIDGTIFADRPDYVHFTSTYTYGSLIQYRLLAGPMCPYAFDGEDRQLLCTPECIMFFSLCSVHVIDLKPEHKIKKPNTIKLLQT